MPTSHVLLVTALLTGAVAPSLAAQVSTSPATPAATAAPNAPVTPPARPQDVESVDAIITALYDVISGPAGQKRDWDRFESLFHPGARLIPTGSRPDGSNVARAITPQEYRQRSAPSLEGEGFFERELKRITEQFGNVVHAFSTYDSRHKADDATPFARGINSIQLFNDGTRWWVMSILWQNEGPESPIPAKYLP